jgi:hypothetical protein
MLKKILKRLKDKIIYLSRNVCIEETKDLIIKINELEKRISQVEYRSVNRRFFAIEQLTEYLIGADISGDYCEFGVWQGATFNYAYKNLSLYFKDMNFWAFDSFEGLPKPVGIDAIDGYSSKFQGKEFYCSLDDFNSNLINNGVDLNKVKIVKGWFDNTLNNETAAKYGMKKITAAWIDCDLYESTVPVLKFITPYLSVGSVLLFDDWRCFRNHPDFCEQRACREWLINNPKIKLNELFSFGWNGIAFTVVSC